MPHVTTHLNNVRKKKCKQYVQDATRHMWGRERSDNAYRKKIEEVTTLTEKQIGRASASTNMTHTDKTESKWKEDDTGGVKKFQ